MVVKNMIGVANDIVAQGIRSGFNPRQYFIQNNLLFSNLYLNNFSLFLIKFINNLLKKLHLMSL